MTSDPTAAFFDGLAERGHEPLLEYTSGTVRFELTNGKRTERWLVSIDKGDIAVSRRKGTADCTLRAPRDVFDSVVSGETNATAAVLRGAIVLEGNWELLVVFQRLFPGPPAADGRSGR